MFKIVVIGTSLGGLQAQFSHGLCNECLRGRYSEVYQRLLQKGEIK
jgi:hypothetical protein